MIVKKRNLPREIQKLEALSRRLPDKHPRYPHVLEQLAKLRAGYRGEQSLDYHISFLSEENFLILQNLRLRNYFSFFLLNY